MSRPELPAAFINIQNNLHAGRKALICSKVFPAANGGLSHPTTRLSAQSKLC